MALISLVVLGNQTVFATAAATSTAHGGANTVAVPTQILTTGINLVRTDVSPNTVQLAETIGIIPTLRKIEALRLKVALDKDAKTIDALFARQELMEAKAQAALLIQRTCLEIDFALAEIEAEQNVYNSVLATYTADRDKSLARMNAASFISNGALWAACEGLAIPTYTYGGYAIPSGILGIIAGVVPSAASMLTLKMVSGKKTRSETAPNMLAKLFNYPTTPDIEYPSSVWAFLTQVPPDGKTSGTRLEQLIERWITDANIKAFTDSTSKTQLDVITATKAQKGGLSIATLTARNVMLEELSSEIMKMKRMLLEINMVVLGEKHLHDDDVPAPHHSP